MRSRDEFCDKLNAALDKDKCDDTSYKYAEEILTEMEYDDRGNLVLKTEALGTVAERTTEFVHDSDNNLLQIRRLWALNWGSFPTNRTPPMKLGKLLLTTSLCASMAAPAFAQGRPFNEIDSDSDGFLTEAELADAFGDRGALRIISRSDSDGDGMLTRDEIRSSDDEDDEDDEDDDEDDDESDDDESDESDDEDDDESDESDESDDDEGSADSDSDESDDSEDDED